MACFMCRCTHCCRSVFEEIFIALDSEPWLLRAIKLAVLSTNSGTVNTSPPDSQDQAFTPAWIHAGPIPVASQFSSGKKECPRAATTPSVIKIVKSSFTLSYFLQK